MRNLLIIFCTAIISFSCSPTSNISPEKLAKNACECFSQLNSGSIDERSTPCLSTPINDNQEEILDKYYSNLTLQDALTTHMMKVTVVMIQSCDKYFDELDGMFTNMYPETPDSDVILDIQALQDSINDIQLADSIKLNLLHKKLALLTKSRQLEEALNLADSISNDYSESETYLIRTYIFTLQGKYEMALEQVNKAVNAGNKGYNIFGELIKRKKKDR
ncbi:hypothetical protein SAMN04488029_3198 [Reichenbachiella faecimaris]|uniref:Tetratricopeptide repeat-containing protein n=1 Tax=Reichenbachiella faecimaris TaxID=692418 RepID=A0A1W2GKD9_REIFA|nr:hypothetical protein [Reichenbachiella faecimaris]SMD37031.1 hypothetical protein SAMN04488029_3198 [Reichenbachiella faecimaris]